MTPPVEEIEEHLQGVADSPHRERATPGHAADLLGHRAQAAHLRRYPLGLQATRATQGLQVLVREDSAGRNRWKKLAGRYVLLSARTKEYEQAIGSQPGGKVLKQSGSMTRRNEIVSGPDGENHIERLSGLEVEKIGFDE